MVNLYKSDWDIVFRLKHALFQDLFQALTDFSWIPNHESCQWKQ